MIKLIASDIDGTLLTDQGIMSPQTHRAIHQAIAEGIEFLPVTGRGYAAAQNIIGMQGLQVPMINLNGALVSSAQGQALSQLPLPQDQVVAMCEFLNQADVRYSLVSQDCYYTTDPDRYQAGIIRFLKDQTASHQQAGIPTPSIELDQARAFIQDIGRLKDLPQQDFLKLIFFTDQEDLRQSFREHFAGDKLLTLSSSGRHNVEITQAKASKGQALTKYLEEAGYQKDEVLSIGDSYNDLSMFAVTGHSYAMGNAEPAVQAQASALAPSNQEDGVAWMIKEVLAGRIG
ncbi:Cof-type HAD-IIB family hydrolase [Aerococcus sp. UMB7834]|uniref:Cof-type HAD-IIB family hydrolase n=1 Tax=Aerococcus sp. UMB7834 TaxID=3046342 RepID=UPI00254F6D4F|nr:Cof-type HAD-IIB family hydrolase [Aerococcus sp. UMB7834]MDK6805834.1 Cof-type HAD-IIB family hydrolase [Aerococcus sp. UMB7834]